MDRVCRVWVKAVRAAGEGRWKVREKSWCLSVTWFSSYCCWWWGDGTVERSRVPEKRRADRS